MIRRRKQCEMCASDAQERADALERTELELIRSKAALTAEQDKLAEALGLQTLLQQELNHLRKQEIEEAKARKPATTGRKTAA